MTRNEAVILGTGALLLFAAMVINPWMLSRLLERDLVHLDLRLMIFAVEFALAISGLLLVVHRKTLKVANIALAGFVILLCGSLLLTIDMWLAGVKIDNSVTYIKDVNEVDARLGWKPRPGTGRHFYRGLFDVTYGIDADGLRKMPGVPHPDFNLFFFGDSFTFGHGVADQKTYSYVIAERYLDDRVNIHNAGVMGYGMTQIYLRFLEVENRIGHGDLVILAPLTEDLTRNYETFAERTALRNLMLSNGSEGSQQLRNYPDFSDGTFQYRELPQTLTLSQGLWSRAINAPVSGALFRTLSGGAAKRQRAVDQSLIMLNLIAEKTHAKGARFALVFLPRNNECLTRTYSLNVSRFQYLDLMDKFPSDRDGLDRLIFKGEGHWNDEGQRVAARAMVSVLVEANLIERRYLRD
ncbi:MAG: SGNH/GDSL hydrolase family protein [Propionivibrio sp.]|uniref:SGNH/GDSL hydrolase family protein n=1 Tax=Candidatus Propionivibrio dominans TaxID=2954373 RepID=A0A9D7I9S3_9RHOO|nr:SGNH/GDSL hydrolase family protein [Candidatus Propionivibrio dominans]MBL0167312.1 SGNH/GDSL hydrolase family protein [Propionivibrio sp.]